jgi:hypothetical protein
MGGGQYTLAPGDTPRKISKGQFATEAYWTDIRDANPTRYFKSGDISIVGDEISIPVIEVPQPAPDDSTATTGGTVAARYPRRVVNDYGTYLIFPDEYQPPTLSGQAGDTLLHETEFATLETQKTTEAEASRAQAVTSADDLLSYGVFDWAITDADATNALASLGALPFGQIGPALTTLGADKWARLVDNLPEAQQKSAAWAKVRTAQGKDGLAEADFERFFFLLPDTESVALRTLIGYRFSITVDGLNGNQWTSASLRRLWTILEKLPPDAVQDNTQLEFMLRDQGADGSGRYTAQKKDVIGFGGDLEKQDGYGEIMVDDGTGTLRAVGLNSHVNLFNTVVRHEIGHAVDAAITASTTYVTTEENAGKWKTYPSADAFVDAIVTEGGGMAGHDYPDEAAYTAAMKKAVSETKDFNVALAELQTAGAVTAEVAAADASVGGPVAAVFTKDLWSEAASPWYTQPDRPIMGNRQFHQSYSGSNYVSFQADARTKWGVSAYQFRAPGEWFAECYAVYYSDQDGPTGAPVGTRLRTRNADAAAWFDANVDKGHSLAQQTNQATGAGAGGAGGAGSGGSGGAGGAP